LLYVYLIDIFLELVNPFRICVNIYLTYPQQIIVFYFGVRMHLFNLYILIVIFLDVFLQHPENIVLCHLDLIGIMNGSIIHWLIKIAL